MTDPDGATLAVFDLDGTLTQADTLLPFLLLTRPLSALRYVPPSLVTLLLGRGGRDETKEQLVDAVLRGRSYDDVAAAGEGFADLVVRRFLRSGTTARIADHRAAGHVLAVASASPAFTVEPIAARLGFDHVICTRLEPDEQGRWRYVDGNVRSERKLDRVVALARDLGATRAVAYGDSSDDRPLLGWADRGLMVGRDRLGRTILTEIEAGAGTPVD